MYSAIILRLTLISVLLTANTVAQGPLVVSTFPSANQVGASINTTIQMAFNQELNQYTVNGSNFFVYSKFSGRCFGSLTYNSQTNSIIFENYSEFKNGDIITVIATTGVESSSGYPLSSSHAWMFFIESFIAPATFIEGCVYNTGDNPSSIYTADFDKNGWCDLITSNSNSDDIIGFVNNGLCSFEAGIDLSAGNLPKAVFGSDLDADGDLDIIAANGYSDNILIYENTGNMVFGAATYYDAGIHPISIDCNDYNGDGFMDISVANYYSDSVSIYINLGNGIFESQTKMAVGSNPSFIISSDLDNDGDFDLITANWNSDNLSLLFNLGNGVFEEQTLLSTEPGPKGVTAADFNGDLYTDIAIAQFAVDSLSIYFNSGSGEFNDYRIYLANDGAWSLITADIDGDNDLDIISGNGGQNGFVSILFNQEDKEFCCEYRFYLGEWPTGSSPRSINVADYDNDFDLDIVAARYSMDDFIIILNEVICGDSNKDGSVNVGDILYLINHIFHEGPSPIYEESGDVNCDGHINIGDAVYMANYIFQQGAPVPCANCQ